MCQTEVKKIIYREQREHILSTSQNENEPGTRSLAFVIGLSYVEDGLTV